MPHKKRASRGKGRKHVAPALGAAGAVSLLLGGIVSADAAASPDMPPQTIARAQETSLSEEEIHDVTLTTFHTFDRENHGTPRRFEKLARCYRCTTRITCRCRYSHGKA
jgi:hypothetical protein